MTTKFLIGAFRCQNCNVRITYMEGKRYDSKHSKWVPTCEICYWADPKPLNENGGSWWPWAHLQLRALKISSAFHEQAQRSGVRFWRAKRSAAVVSAHYHIPPLYAIDTRSQYCYNTTKQKCRRRSSRSLTSVCIFRFQKEALPQVQIIHPHTTAP